MSDYDPTLAAATLRSMGYSGVDLDFWLQLYAILNDRNNLLYRRFKDPDGLMNVARITQTFGPQYVEPGGIINFVNAPLNIAGVPTSTWQSIRSYDLTVPTSYMNLTGATLCNPSLQTGCDFSNSDLTGTMIKTDYSYNHFDAANCTRVHFELQNDKDVVEVSYQGTNLTHGYIAPATLISHDYTDAIMDETWFDANVFVAATFQNNRFNRTRFDRAAFTRTRQGIEH